MCVNECKCEEATVAIASSATTSHKETGSHRPVLRVLKHDFVDMPAYQTDGAAGLDLRAYLVTGDVHVWPGETKVVPTGIAVALPAGHEGQVRGRSSMSRLGLVVVLGTVDEDYRGEIGVLVQNTSSSTITLTHGQRIAQLVVAPVARCHVVVVDTLNDTVRGVGGWGSTGK